MPLGWTRVRMTGLLDDSWESVKAVLLEFPLAVELVLLMAVESVDLSVV